jgi:putative transposase
MKQQKAYKYRFYPTEEQMDLLAKTFGCCRYVYNWALRQKTDAYYQRGERLSSHDLRGSNPRPMSEPPST